MAEGLGEYLGNIDLDARKVYMNPDSGQKQTEYSKSFQFGSDEVLLPTIVGGRPVSDKEAVANYLNTGKHLGKFNINDWQKTNPGVDMSKFYNDINTYAKSISKRQDSRY